MSDNDKDFDPAKERGDWGEYRRLVLSKLQTLHEDQEALNKKLSEIENYFKREYVTKQYFDVVIGPIRNIVFGIVGVVGVAFLTALVYLVIGKV